jgi:hypothetical protein
MEWLAAMESIHPQFSVLLEPCNNSAHLLAHSPHYPQLELGLSRVSCQWGCTPTQYIDSAAAGAPAASPLSGADGTGRGKAAAAEDESGSRPAAGLPVGPRPSWSGGAGSGRTPTVTVRTMPLP